MPLPLYQVSGPPASGPVGSPRSDASPPRPGRQGQARAGERGALARSAQASRTYLPVAIQRVLTRAAANHLLPLLNLIASRASGGDPCTACQRELALELGRTVRQVKRGEAELERLGLLAVERARGGTRGQRRTLTPTWFRPVQFSTSYPQSVDDQGTSNLPNRRIRGHACPLIEEPELAGLLTGSRAPARTQTDNLHVSLRAAPGDQAEPQAPARAPSPPDTTVLARALHRHAGMWRNTLTEVERHLRDITAGAGGDETRAWLTQLVGRLRYRPAEQRGALVLGALRSRAAQERRPAPGLFDRPLEAIP